jgi:hypothetical protein
MRRLYRPASRIDAYLLRDLLCQRGIEAQVFNENAQSAMGEIPIDAAGPEVWLDSDDPAVWEKARAIVRDFEQRPSVLHNVFCRGCGEENPANFELCWKCGIGL